MGRTLTFRIPRDRNYTVEKAWEEWQSFCSKWGRYYRSIKRRCDDPSYKAYFTYLNYDHRIQLRNPEHDHPVTRLRIQ